MVEGSDIKIVIPVRGAFRVTNTDGQDLTPNSRKAQGVLALLALAPGVRRTRGFLRDTLWSDRGKPQGAASLRIALSDIRKAFGAQRDVLQADRNDVWFEERLVVIEDNAQAAPGPVQDLLEGLDVPDPAFEAWLDAQRNADAGRSEQQSHFVEPENFKRPLYLAHDVRHAQAPRRQVVFNTMTADNGPLGVIEQVVAELAMRDVREVAEVDVFTGTASGVSSAGLLVHLQAFENLSTDADAPHYGLRMTVESLERGQQLWSNTVGISTAPNAVSDRDELQQTAARLAHSVMRSFEQSISDQSYEMGDSNLLALVGLKKTFAIRADAAVEAEKLLLGAFDTVPRGVYLAWLSQLHSIEYVERLRDRNEVAEKAIERAAHALELEPENSHVLSANANARLVFERDVELAGHLAELAIKANPCNAMAWCTLGHVQLYSDDAETSFVTSSHAQKLAAGSNLQFWVDFQKALACALTGRISEATLLARMSTMLRPEFRAALRYSIAFHSATDQNAMAARAAINLVKLEHDFRPERLADDPDYPVQLMRRTQLYKPEKFRKLKFCA